MRKLYQGILLATTVTTFSCNTVWASPTSAKTGQPATVHRIAQSKSLCLNLTFSNSGFVHRAKLVMNDNGYGSMRVKFFDPVSNRSESIDQRITAQTSAYGILLVGSNPVYAGTSTNHPRYSPDNLLMSIQEDGSPSMVTFDQGGNVSNVAISEC